MALPTDILVDIWLPERTSSHVEAELMNGVWVYRLMDNGVPYEGEIHNHQGTYLELLEKILHGRNMSGQTTT